MSHILEQAFGPVSKLDLYADVLKVSKDCSLPKLRKGYYQQALIYHPDKNKSADAKLKFQAISWTYQFLKDPEKRAAYDEDGVLPFDDEDTDFDSAGSNQWKNFFASIFGKVSVNRINEFAAKYKMSDEEEKDVLQNYEKFKGSLIKMLEHVILSEERDVQRWMEDYIQPAIEKGSVPDYSKTMQKELPKIQKKLSKEKPEIEEEEEDDDSDRTVTEDSDHPPPPRSARKGKKAAPVKAKRTKAKKAKNSEADLIAAIRNKGNRNPLAAIGARYGVSMDDDPLDDESFAKLQKKYKK
eukprot:Nitzschia sp. Nitz4//scaffold59_size112058//48135//49025//NITZ4_004108-RA/size112058-processed-gene-0.189-mRNA-1//1//CDS//3329555120//2709//frame0